MAESFTSTDIIAREFCDCTLPKVQWTHAAHLQVGLWHLLHYSLTDAVVLLRERIQQYNVVYGVANTETSGYHETITQFYIKVIAYFLEGQIVSKPVDQLAEELVEQWGDRNLLFVYYSKERLMSQEARQQWIDPDITPLF